MSISSKEKWTERAAAFLKHKLREAEVTSADLAKRFKKHSFKAETEASITSGLKRGTFSATFFLACIAAMELDGYRRVGELCIPGLYGLWTRNHRPRQRDSRP